jgi:hypothetical protein
MLFVYNVGRYAAHEVVFRYITSCKVSLLCCNHESCIIGFVSEHDSSSSSRSPSETVLRFRFSAPGHIATASVTRHLAGKQSHVLQELDAKIRVAEEKREK